MIDKLGIVSDLKDRNLTQGEIAQKHNCSITTVIRLAKEFSLQMGRGIKHFWQFTESSEELAYVIGVYLTDGSVKKEHKTENIRQFVLSNTSAEYIQKVYEFLDLLGLKPKHQKTRIKSKGHYGNMPILGVATYSSMFSQWLYDSCSVKSQIPTFLFNAPLNHKIAFLAGAIDGDGYVAKDGSIMIRGIDLWLHDIPRLLDNENIRCSKVAIDRMLDSGKPYYRVSIRRFDFREKGGWCAIPEKYNRIVNGKNEAKYDPSLRKKYPCTVCGKVVVWRKGGRCDDCYRKADDTLAHLKRIAPIGNKKGNQARWGNRDKQNS